MEKLIEGLNGQYSVTDEGEVISLKFNKRHTLKPTHGNRTSKHPRVGLYLPDGAMRTFLVHLLVAGAFLPPKQPGQEIRHLDGDELNCRPSNLRWGTRSENVLDQVRHGVHNNASKTHCKQGHEFSPENTRPRENGGRRCITCARAAALKYSRARRK